MFLLFQLDSLFSILSFVGARSLLLLLERKRGTPKHLGPIWFENISKLKTQFSFLISLHSNSVSITLISDAVWIARLHLASGILLLFSFSLFLFFQANYVDFQRQILLFMNSACTVHIFKNIKNGSHSTIYTFKNYFATIFSVFNFQFQKK